jgi:hypothetical protein
MRNQGKPQNGSSHWSNLMEIATKIKKIKKISQDKYRITLQYVDGFQGVADLSSLFLDRKKPLIGEILRGNLFSKCFIESGALAWPNGYELCPDMLRALIRQGSRKEAA